MPDRERTRRARTGPPSEPIPDQILRVGIVSYYAPPQAAVASHRVLRLSRALLAAGHEVHWVTVDEGRLLERDASLAALIPDEIVIHGLGGPTLWSLGTARTLLQKVRRTLAYERGKRLPIPDHHFEWVQRLRRRLPAIARRERLDVVLLTCGPHGQLLAVPGLRRALPGLRIVADYRDLLSGNVWTGSQDAAVRQRVLRHEREMLGQVDALFVNSEEALRAFRETVGEVPCPVAVMRNAADFGLAEQIAAQRPAAAPADGIHLGFYGTIFPRRRMLPVLEAMALLPDAVLERTTLHVYSGAVDSRRMLEEDLGAVRGEVRPRVLVHDYEPFAEALRTMMAMSALVLVNGAEPADNVFVPGKLYDYLMARRPVLFIGADGDAWRIVERASGSLPSGTGLCYRYAELDGFAAAIAALEPRPGDLVPSLEFGTERTFAPLLEWLAAIGGGQAAD